MTIRIPLRVVAFVVYTLALLGGAFGISYAVFEWRDDVETFDASAIERRINDLERQKDAGPTQAELDSQRCEAALEALGTAAARPQVEGQITFIPSGLPMAVDRYCK